MKYKCYMYYYSYFNLPWTVKVNSRMLFCTNLLEIIVSRHRELRKQISLLIFYLLFPSNNLEREIVQFSWQCKVYPHSYIMYSFLSYNLPSYFILQLVLQQPQFMLCCSLFSFPVNLHAPNVEIIVNCDHRYNLML